jgi:hypothetical protein
MRHVGCHAVRRIPLGVLLVLALAACAPLDIRGPGVSDSVSNVRISAGLREALQVATDNAVRTTGRLDGYFANQAIRILMPENLRTLELGLRTLGQGQMADEFILGMNRAAERAAPAARPIFLDAIRGLTFGDVRQILGGGDTAATDFFRDKTTDRLTVAFHPAVVRALDEVGVTRQYRAVVAQAQRIPALHLEAFDLDRYVVGKALDGLFLVIADEERRIRRDPAARVTALLKEVFGLL